jgi:omega-6 fatty acid desaturase (delta-12 desaturase)
MLLANRYLRDPAGIRANALALAYIAVTYFGGWWLMAQPHWAVNLAGVLACAHGMIIAAYLIHDCAHNGLFERAEHNACLGSALNWVTGACYGTYEDLRHKHMRHHVDNADPLIFDYRGLLKRHPWLERSVFALEWAYVPAVELLMHGMLFIAPFVYASKRGQRGRLVRVLLVRGALFAVLLWWSPRAVAGYAIAYLLMLTFLRFMDTYQHNYEILLNLDDPDAVFPYKGDRDYEERNTYTNFISTRWPWLNLLALNFSYHNAHHTRPVAPWYRLPALHRELYGDGAYAQAIGLREQLVSYHRNRLARIYSDSYGEVEVSQALREGTAVGANGLNFLTAF